MAGWHHWLDGHESEWTPGVCDGQGGLACCDSWGRKESDTTERLNWTDSQLTILWFQVGSRGTQPYIYMDPFSAQTPLQSRLPRNIEQRSTCYTVGPCWLSGFCFFFDFLFCTVVSFINNIMIISGEQLRDPAIHMHESLLHQTNFPSIQAASKHWAEFQ